MIFEIINLYSIEKCISHIVPAFLDETFSTLLQCRRVWFSFNNTFSLCRNAQRSSMASDLALNEIVECPLYNNL